MNSLSIQKAMVCSPNNTCVTVYGQTAQTINRIAIVAVVLIAGAYLYKALQ